MKLYNTYTYANNSIKVLIFEDPNEFAYSLIRIAFADVVDNYFTALPSAMLMEKWSRIFDDNPMSTNWHGIFLKKDMITNFFKRDIKFNKYELKVKNICGKNENIIALNHFILKEQKCLTITNIVDHELAHFIYRVNKKTKQNNNLIRYI